MLEITLRVPGNNFKEKPIFQNSSTFPSFPPQPEKFKFKRRIFGNVVNIPFYVIKRRFSGKPILFREKIYVLITFGISNKITQTFLKKKSKIYVHWILFVEWNVIAQVFHFQRKIIPIISLGILTDETSKRRIKISKGFPKLYSTCPDDFNHIKHVYFPKNSVFQGIFVFGVLLEEYRKFVVNFFTGLPKL